MVRFLAVMAACALLGGAAGVAVAAPADPAVGFKPGGMFKDCAECAKMVVIPPGAFVMGSTRDEQVREGVPKAFADREGPQHTVTIRYPFAMSRNEITRGEYAAFVADTHRPDPPEGCGVYNAKDDNWKQRPGFSWRNPGFAQTDQHPAACISWDDARDYAAWLARKTGRPYRLATEAEWEYAARAGTTTARYWGDAAEGACKSAQILTSGTVEALGSPKSETQQLVCADSHSFTMPVGSFAPNPFGLNDMIGNIFEWVADCYHPNYVGAPTDGSAWDEPNCKLRLPKGGAFHSPPWIARAAFHGGPVPPEYRPVASGIRVVRDLPAP
jgi:sulfatase modifying factor 1